jgi:hypothetical protein
MAVDAVFHRAGLQEILELVVGRLGHEAVDANCPRFGLEISGVLRRIALVRAELVEIIVRGDVGPRRRFVVGLEPERFPHGLRLLRAGH